MRKLLALLVVAGAGSYLAFEPVRTAVGEARFALPALAPSLGALVVLVACAVMLIRFVRHALTGAGAARDPLRWYDKDTRAESFRRAQGRCEYMSMWLVRCGKPAEHADHFIPWSKGGATSLVNCVASCATHNTSKGAKLMTRRSARSLERRRRRYFPPGCDVSVGQTYRRAVLLAS